MCSLSTRSATRAAWSLRWATSPARLAMRKPWTATGMTMAMNISAASTSASVKPALRPLLGEGVAVRTRARSVVSVTNFIAQSVAGLREPERHPITVQQPQGLRAAFGQSAIGQKTNLRQVVVSSTGGGAAGESGVGEGSRAGNVDVDHFDPKVPIQREVHCLGVALDETGIHFQTVGPLLCIHPQHNRQSFGDRPALALPGEGQKPPGLGIERASAEELTESW